ncbi:flagellar FlbD family protein [Peribacillus sp. SCS-155]|uniref:flagellar FlbD family protein n=1 Tax=Peribacillus sedimenti TaxID=3115297 RepID=UPI003906BA43
MIKVTRLNGKSFTVNALYVETVESFPDTTITFTTGRKIVVAETEDAIIESITKFYRSINVLGLRDETGGNEE